MPVYIIAGDQVTARSDQPTKLAKNAMLVTSQTDLDDADLSISRLIAIWNGLPEVAPVTKFKDRKTALRRLWAAFAHLPVTKQKAASRAETKQAAIIALLRRPEGATVDEVAAETGWQRHSVRGLFAGTLRKKLGLTIVSEKEDRGRVYRIA